MPDSIGALFSQPDPGNRDSQAFRDGPAGQVMKWLDEIASLRQAHVRLRGECEEASSKMQLKLDAHAGRLRQYRLAYFHDLGRQLRGDQWARRDRERLIEILKSLADILFEVHDVDVIEDLARYSGRPSAELLGLNEEDSETGNLQDLMRSLLEDAGAGGFPGKAEAQASSSAAENANDPPPNPPRVKTGEAAEMLGDIRTLYLLLARALHPDKEADRTRREEKTRWMQKVTAAYAGKSLGGLLDILARNPLDAIGPYLAETPAKTLKGFAKRLKKEHAALSRVSNDFLSGQDPRIRRIFRKGSYSEAAYKEWEKSLEDDVKVFKQRAAVYRTSEGVRDLINLARVRDPRELV